MHQRQRAGPHRTVHHKCKVHHNYIECREHPESGFTLIELLVVIIIIGILAAIAIPIFLNQRGKAQEGAAKTDIRNLANQQELYLTENQTYGTIATLLADGMDVRVSGGVTLSVVRFNSATSYCLSAVHAATGNTYYYDSAGGGLQPSGAGGCPVTVAGAAGDSITG